MTEAYKGYVPADLQKAPADAAAAAASTTSNSYDKVIRVPLVKNKKYTFWFTYLYEDPDTKKITESDRSPTVQYTFDIPNLTKPVQNLTLTAGFKSYGVKLDIDPTSIQEDMVFYESLTGAFAGEEYIVYVGTSTNVTINTSDFAPRWVKVRARDKWQDANHSDATAGPVTPKNADPDTSTPPDAPTGVSATGSIDVNDKSGFSGSLTVIWSANTNTNTAGYVIRWSTQNPIITQNPVWEYGQVEGKDTTRFTVTGLLPNTLYYYQVTAKSPYNAISWASPYSGTFGPIADTNAPADVWAQLRSVLSIGGKTADLFKIGTGISQSINTSTTTTPTLTAGTYSGVILNKSTTNLGHNYWLNTGQFRVGSATNFLYWDGSNLYTTGKINATGGSFTGDVQLNGGTLYAGTLPLSGARVRFDSSGFFAYDSTSTSLNTGQTLAITAADGKIDARQGYIGGWTINGTAQTVGSIYSNNTKLESNGTITLGDTTGTLQSIVRLSATDTYRLWVGSQSSSNAAFKVDSNGKLYATGAVLGAGSTIDGYATSATVTGVSTRLTTVENNYVTSTTLSTGLATKNTTFVQGTTPTAVRVGDLWIDTANNNTLKTWTGSAWTDRTNTTYATKTDLNSKLNASAYLVQSVIDNKISADANGFEVYSGSASTTGSGVKITGGGILGYKNGNPTFTITSAGDATFYGNLSGATGTFQGSIVAGVLGTSYYIDSAYTKNGITGLGVNAIAIESSSTGGVYSHWYPYVSGGNFDLGTIAFPWNDLRASGSVMVGYTANGSDTVGATGGPKTKLVSNGNIYANTLGTSSTVPASGNQIIQSGGYLRVYVAASSKKYKENIVSIDSKKAYDTLSSLRPVTFNYKKSFLNEYEEYGIKNWGLIAEEVNAADKIGDLTIYKNDEPDSVKYEILPTYILAGIKEIIERITNIENRLDAIGA